MSVATPADAAHAAAQFMIDAAATPAIDGHFAVAVSGGRTPRLMFDDIVATDDDLSMWDVWQVDERVAPEGDAARNLLDVTTTLATRGAQIHALPVGEADLEQACALYAASLPTTFDLIHLGLGTDGHTASLVPGDAVLNATQPVAVTSFYQGHRRLTFTYATLARARVLLWLVTGAEKANALARLLTGDDDIPAGRVSAARSVIVADHAALEG